MKQQIIHIDQIGTKRWYQYGELHREDGPSVQTIDGSEYWYQNGLLHREEGPAYKDPFQKAKWFYKGQEILASNLKEFERYIKCKAFW